jgi:hypothetical protein
MEALGLGEFARVTVAHRVHVFWIVHAAERTALVGSGATSSIPPMGSAASDSAIHRDFRVVSKE